MLVAFHVTVLKENTPLFVKAGDLLGAIAQYPVILLLMALASLILPSIKLFFQCSTLLLEASEVLGFKFIIS